MNYSKVLQIMRMVELIDSGADDEQFCVAGYSADLYRQGSIAQEDPDALIILAQKEESADQFWYHVRSLRRPIVFFRSGASTRWTSSLVRPLYSGSDPDALRITEGTVISPFRISFEGLDGTHPAGAALRVN